MIFPNLRIVLIETSHPGNIGATARAMKNMGIEQLVLVNPHCYPSPRATARASGANSILEQAIVVNDFAAAIQDCQLVVGTSTRARTHAIPRLDARAAAAELAAQAISTQMAIVFGREQTGLTNEELLQCHYHLSIPCNPQFSSLNIAAAVQVVCYELWLVSQACTPIVNATADAEATMQEVTGFYEHLEKVLIQIEFLDPVAPKLLLPRLQRLFQRSHLSKVEVNILRGMLTAIQKKLKVLE